MCTKSEGEVQIVIVFTCSLRKISAPVSQCASLSRHAEALMCDILRNQESLRQRLIGTAPQLKAVNFVFNDLNLQPPMHHSIRSVSRKEELFNSYSNDMLT